MLSAKPSVNQLVLRQALPTLIFSFSFYDRRPNYFVVFLRWRNIIGNINCARQNNHCVTCSYYYRQILECVRLSICHLKVLRANMLELKWQTMIPLNIVAKMNQLLSHCNIAGASFQLTTSSFSETVSCLIWFTLLYKLWK